MWEERDMATMAGKRRQYESTINKQLGAGGERKGGESAEEGLHGNNKERRGALTTSIFQPPRLHQCNCLLLRGQQ